jgi:hypothetical protein
MRKLQAGLTAATLAAAFAATSIMPADAAPTFVPKPITAQSDVIQVRDGWYNGYRGYPRYRHGYHYNDGWWFPAGAFVAGALIGSAIANSNYYGGGYYNNYYGGGYYPRAYYPRAYPRAYYPRAYYPDYYQRRVYYRPRGTAYRQGYRDGYRDAYYGSRYYNDITCTQRLREAGRC